MMTAFHYNFNTFDVKYFINLEVNNKHIISCEDFVTINKRLLGPQSNITCDMCLKVLNKVCALSAQSICKKAINQKLVVQHIQDISSHMLVEAGSVVTYLIGVKHLPKQCGYFSVVCNYVSRPEWE